jgi:antitoxin (DNA-binding transcriptional repressor) of toxin-antitoxin stability system
MYTMHKAKSMLSQLVEDAINGEEVIIARGKDPVVKLVPLTAKTTRKPGGLKGKLTIVPGAFDPLSKEELKDWGIG